MARVCKTYLCVHVCTVHVYKTAVLVDDVADLFDLYLKHTVGRRICDHQTCKVLCVCDSFLTQLLNVDVSVLVTSYKYNAEAGHCCGSRVGTVS